MDIYQDCRLVTVNSNDAYQKLNADYNSDIVFSFPNVIKDDRDILHTTVGVVSAEIPVSWWLIDSDTNKMDFRVGSTDFLLVLPFGNYNGDNFLTTMQDAFEAILIGQNIKCIITLDLITGKLTFKFETTQTVTFFYNNLTDGLFRILGFTVGSNYISTQIGVNMTIIAPNPMNILGIKQIRVCSTNLSTEGNFSSGELTANTILCCIPIDVPAWALINYTNKNNLFSKLKSKNVNTIDLQLVDELGRFLQMNSINWTLTIQFIIYRRFRNNPQGLAISSMNDNLQDIENVLEVISAQLPDKNEEVQQVQEQQFQNQNDENIKSLGDELGMLVYE